MTWAEAVDVFPIAQQLYPFTREGADKRSMHGGGCPGLLIVGCDGVSAMDLRAVAERFGGELVPK